VAMGKYASSALRAKRQTVDIAVSMPQEASYIMLHANRRGVRLWTHVGGAREEDGWRSWDARARRLGRYECSPAASSQSSTIVDQ
jgi:hypothetical protein